MTTTRENTLDAYNAIFILDTRDYDKPVESLVEHITTVLSELGATVSDVKNHGRIEFIRVTDRNHPGDTYLEFDFEGPRGISQRLQERLRLDNTVKRVHVELRGA